MRNWKFMAFGIGLAAVGFFAAPSTSEAQKGGGGRGGGGARVSAARPAVSPARAPVVNNSNNRTVNNYNNGSRYGNGYNNGYYGNGYNNGYYGNGLGIGVGGVYLGLGGGYNNGLYGNRGYGGGYNNGYYGGGGGVYYGGGGGAYYGGGGGVPIYDDASAPSIAYTQPGAPNATQSFYPSNDANRGTVVVMVPDNAELFWGGSRSTLTGTSRTFSTLPLSADGSMQTFEARWTGPDGKAVTRTREIRAMPNTSVVLDFTKPGNDRN